MTRPHMTRMEKAEQFRAHAVADHDVRAGLSGAVVQGRDRPTADLVLDSGDDRRQPRCDVGRRRP